jgi:SRR1
MENDAWTHVKSKRKNGPGKPKKHIIVSKKNPLVTNTKDNNEDCGAAQDVIANCTSLSGTLSQSSLLKCLLSELGRTNFTQFSTTIALGIGQFCSSQSSLLQLAMLLSIRTHQRRLSADGDRGNSSSSSSDNDVIIEDTSERKSNCMIFDPLLSSKEREVCSLLNCPVSSENRMGKHQIDSGPTLFFMPHCPHRLYINLLWENWSQLDGVIILGNRCILV